MSTRLKWLIAIAVVLVIAVGGKAAWGEARESRATGLAVKYGFAPSQGEATSADRCAGVILEDFHTTSEAERGGLGEQAAMFLAPRVCALAVSRGLVANDGTMSEQDSFRVTTDVMNEIGPERVQMLVFDELAVTYRLARPGKVSRWNRCVAMAYSGRDAAAAAGADVLPQAEWRRGAREACAEGIKRGIVPASGVPEVGSPEAAELFALICSSARAAGSCV